MTLRQRISQTRTSRWIRFTIVTAIFIAWVIWLGNPWVLICLPLLFDIYITGYIPLTWWKKSKSAAVRTVMSWVDAIVYALVIVYFVFTFVGQNYQIPSSSLEKTLLVGDYLWVNKMSYGPRVPQTPLHFPLVQNTLPIVETKSYIEWPQWTYHRLKGLGSVKAGDIVVFNFPAGDTVALKMQNPDYYTLIKYCGNKILADNPTLADGKDQEAIDNLIYALGRKAVHSNTEDFGNVIYRPVDRRENYVKRAVGLPGQTLKITDGQIYIDGKLQPMPQNAQFNYYIQSTHPLTANEWDQMGIAQDDRTQVAPNPADYDNWLAAGFDPTQPIYVVPLTQTALDALPKNIIVKTMRQPSPQGEFLFPDHISDQWTRSDYGPVLIPAKGQTIRLNAQNWPMYARAIRNYEYHPDSYLKDGQVYIDGRPVQEYTFAMDYYFMMGDNRDCSLDSRYWGFVPEDHIVGKPMRVLVSFDKDKPLLRGGLRWDRILLNANAGF